MENDSAEGPKPLKGLPVCLLIAGAYVGAGFGVLNGFWFLGGWNESLPGLWSFRSATLGDGLLLPLLLASLLLITANSTSASRERLPAVVAFCLASALFLGLVATWVLDPSPTLNWTIPSPHHLNAAGVYHALFGSVLSGTLAATFVVALRRTVGTSRQGRGRLLDLWLVAATCFVAFAGLVGADSIDSRDAKILFLLRPEFLGALAVAATVLLVVSRSDKKRMSNIPTLLPFLAAPCIVLAFVEPSAAFHVRGILAVPLTCLVGATLSHFALNRSRYWQLEWPSVALLVLALGIGLERIPREHLSGTVWLAITWLLLAGFLVLRIRGNHSLKENFPLVLASGYLIYLLGIESAFDSSKNADNAILLSFVFVPFTLLRLPRAASSRYVALIEDELELGDSVDRSFDKKRSDGCRSLEQSYWSTWIDIIAFAIALVGAFLGILYERGVLSSIQTKIANTESFRFQPTSIVLLAVAASIVIALFAMASLTASEKVDLGSSHRRSRWLSIRLEWPVAAACISCCLLWAVTPWLSAYFAGDYPLAVRGWLDLSYPVAAIVALWMAVVIRESIQYSVANLELARIEGLARLLPRVTALASASVIFWLFGAGIWHRESIASLSTVGQYTLLVVLGSVTVNSAVTQVLYSATPSVQNSLAEPPFGSIRPSPRHLSLYSPPTNVANDTMLHGLLVLVVIILIYAAVTISELLPKYRIAIIPLAIASPITIFLPLYAFFLQFTRKNAAEHSSRERNRISSSIMVRAGNRKAAERVNDRRVREIEDKFERVFRYASRVSFLYVGFDRLSKLLDRLMPEKPEEYAINFVEAFDSCDDTDGWEKLGKCRIYRFKLVGLESTPIDGQIFLRSQGAIVQQKSGRVDLYKRDWKRNLLEIPVTAQLPPGEYVLSIQLQDKAGFLGSMVTVPFSHQCSSEETDVIVPSAAEILSPAENR